MMLLSDPIIQSIDQSILCWLATADTNGLPNVSPKEIFTAYQDTILVANIASPNTLKNISINKQVCISFINIYVQKGWQIKGSAKVITRGSGKEEAFKLLDQMTGGKYPFNELFEIHPITTKAIVAPSYFMFPDESVEEKVTRAKKAYERRMK